MSKSKGFIADGRKNTTQAERGIGGAWAGGDEGMEVTELVLRDLDVSRSSWQS